MERKRHEDLKKIVFLETQAEYYCADGSKRQEDYLADAHQLRMQQSPVETRPLYKLRSALMGQCVYQ